MKRRYETGTSNNEISIDVKVGTVGIAYTAVYLARSGGQFSKLAESLLDGCIKTKSLGQANQLKNAYLVIRTTIDLSTISNDLWADNAHKVFERYTLIGGLSGIQIFNYDTDDIDIVFDGKIVIITKPIELI